ncbi:MAG: phosphomethylpyrimidine synthase ThiC [Acidobacteria bacterium]|nr:phosphomethylpyrimidine synthase ThiC [Acidobacteriota bacterium]
MSIINDLRAGDLPAHFTALAANEGVSTDALVEGVLAGTIVAPRNHRRALTRDMAVGKGLRTKVNANLGTSPDHDVLEEELDKLRVCIEYGVDAVMDLSTGSDIRGTRLRILGECGVPLGTVPMYEASVRSRRRYGDHLQMTVDDLFQVIEDHGADGVDFITVHCGAVRSVVDAMHAQGRVMGMVSRGGALLVEWMVRHDRENPLYEHFDRLLEIAGRHEMTLSLGDGFRPGCLADATDRAQVGELLVLGELTRRARAAGVQTMIEGPGHVPLDQIAENIRLEKALCEGAPFYVLGPLVTDIAPGYDHITGAIGGAVAAMHGADFLCYVTPAEHLRLPTVEDVRLGVMASRIAAHAADIAKGVPGAMAPDVELSRARKRLDWEGQFRNVLDPRIARQFRGERPPKDADLCTMCGEFCAIRASTAATEAICRKSGKPAGQ